MAEGTRRAGALGCGLWEIVAPTVAGSRLGKRGIERSLNALRQREGRVVGRILEAFGGALRFGIAEHGEGEMRLSLARQV